MIGIYLQLGELPEATYHEINNKVHPGNPEESGLKLHTCFKEGDNLAVFDVWESKEDFERFAQALAPIAAEAGVTEMKPQFVEMVDYYAR